MNSTFPVNLLGSRQNLKSAEAAGEGYPERSSLPINAIGTAVAALLGSHFPNTNYFAQLAPPHQADVWAAGALPWSRHRSSSPSCWPPCWFLCAISPVNGSSSLRLLPDQSYESHDCSIVFCPNLFFRANYFCSNCRQSNCCQSNYCQSNYFWSNCCQPNCCQSNCCQPNV